MLSSSVYNSFTENGALGIGRCSLYKTNISTHLTLSYTRYFSYIFLRLSDHFCQIEITVSYIITEFMMPHYGLTKRHANVLFVFGSLNKIYVTRFTAYICNSSFISISVLLEVTQLYQFT